MAKDTKVRSKISFIIRLAKNLLASIYMAQNAKVSSVDDGNDDKMVKKPLFFKKLNVIIDKKHYLKACKQSCGLVALKNPLKLEFLLGL